MHRYAGEKKLATLFFEPSTRTRLSFEAAMLDLGGSVLGFSSAETSSASKGESVSDTTRVVGCYADIIAMRHPKEGAPLAAAMKSYVPIINAGDGGHNHPTQTLTDLLTIKTEKGRLDSFTIGFCGDLKFGRTVHSLISALSRYKNIKYVFISPPELKLPDYIKTDVLDALGLEYTEIERMDEVLPELDILYMTRIQGERFADKNEYLRLRGEREMSEEELEQFTAEHSARVQNAAKLSYVVRTFAIAAALVLAFLSGLFDVLATAIPLLMYRPLMFLVDMIIRKKGE